MGGNSLARTSRASDSTSSSKNNLPRLIPRSNFKKHRWPPIQWSSEQARLPDGEVPDENEGRGDELGVEVVQAGHAGEEPHGEIVEP